MNILYITADKIGAQSGGGTVTNHEYKALCKLGGVVALGHQFVQTKDGMIDPFATDTAIAKFLEQILPTTKFDLAHFYAGCFTETVQLLKKYGVKISYTVAAHDNKLSREEHLRLGYDYPYPHMVDPFLFSKYTEGYRLADLNIVPSKLSADFQESIGCKNVRIIAHGTTNPSDIPPIPKRFAIGYMGAMGPDKGIIYNLQACKAADVPLVIGGREAFNHLDIIRRYGGGNIELTGWVEKLSDFYSKISAYSQSSRTEGFGIEVIESIAYKRPVICSDGCGAIDVIQDGQNGWGYKAGDIDNLIRLINIAKVNQLVPSLNNIYLWQNIENKYMEIWNVLLES